MSKTKQKFGFIDMPLEIIFAVLGLIFGLFFVFINPPFQTNDSDRHFFHAYHLSRGQILPKVQGDKVGGELPDNLVNVVNSLQGIPIQGGSDEQLSHYRQLLSNRIKEGHATELMPSVKSFYHDFMFSQNPIPYIPHALGIAIGGIFNSNPIWLYWFGSILGLLCYIILLYFALKLTPVFKTVIFLYALTPMAIYQGSSVTYDMACNALTYLILAVSLKFAFEKDYILKKKDYILYLALVILLFYSKAGVPLIPFLIFIVPAERFGGTKMRKLAVIAGLSVIFLLLYQFLVRLTWAPFMPDNPPSQILFKSFGEKYSAGYIISHPLWTIWITIKNIIYQRQDWIGGAIGRFGYAYLLLPKSVLIIHGLALLFAALFDGKPGFEFNLRQKIILIIIGWGNALMTIIGALAYMTPSGGELIFGLQGRYFLPFVPIMLLVFYNNVFYYKDWERWKNWGAAAYISIILIFTLIFIQKSFYG